MKTLRAEDRPLPDDLWVDRWNQQRKLVIVEKTPKGIRVSNVERTRTWTTRLDSLLRNYRLDKRPAKTPGLELGTTAAQAK